MKPLTMRISGTRRSWDATPRPRTGVWLLSALALFALALGAGEAFPWASASALMAENGPVESLQAWMLCAVALLYLVAGFRSRDAKAAFCILVAAACVLAVQRELPVCESVFFEGGVCLTHTAKHGIWIAVALGTAALLALARIDWRAFFRVSNLLWVWPVVLSALLLASAELFEAVHHQEFEEILEFAAYVHLGAFGLWLLATTR